MGLNQEPPMLFPHPFPDASGDKVAVLLMGLLILSGISIGLIFGLLTGWLIWGR